MALYNYSAVEKLFSKLDDDFQIYTISGSLCDSHIVKKDGYKTMIITEKYLNEYSSAVTIRQYNKMPKKYKQVIDLLDDGEIDKASKLFYKRG
mgnify:CR=1 FL=1|nr:MAG TPA: hypothetical protein [Caudoviricetes sp.]